MGVPAEATDPIIQVVNGDKQDVRLFLGTEAKAWEGKKDGEEKDEREKEGMAALHWWFRCSTRWHSGS